MENDPFPNRHQAEMNRHRFNKNGHYCWECQSYDCQCDERKKVSTLFCWIEKKTILWNFQFLKKKIPTQHKLQHKQKSHIHKHTHTVPSSKWLIKCYYQYNNKYHREKKKFTKIKLTDEIITKQDSIFLFWSKSKIVVVHSRFTENSFLIFFLVSFTNYKNDDTIISRDIQFTGYPSYGWDPSRTLNTICAERRCEPSLPGCRCDPTSTDPMIICCCCNQYRNNTQQRLCSQRVCVFGDCNCIGEKGSRVSV